MTSTLINFMMVFLNVMSVTIGIYFSEKIKSEIVVQGGMVNKTLSVFVAGILFALVILVSVYLFFGYLKREIIALIPVEAISYVFIFVLFFCYLVV